LSRGGHPQTFPVICFAVNGSISLRPLFCTAFSENLVLEKRFEYSSKKSDNTSYVMRLCSQIRGSAQYRRIEMWRAV
jgi:hypothetical protein